MKKSIKLLVVILIISTLFVSFTNKVNAATSRDEWMTVSASNSKTYATGSMSCDPIYWGNVTTTIGYSTGYQTYYKSASVSAKSGTY